MHKLPRLGEYCEENLRLILIFLIGFLALPASIFKEVDCVRLPFSELLHLRRETECYTKSTEKPLE